MDMYAYVLTNKTNDQQHHHQQQAKEMDKQ